MRHPKVAYWFGFGCRYARYPLSDQRQFWHAGYSTRPRAPKIPHVGESQQATCSDSPTGHVCVTRDPGRRAEGSWWERLPWREGAPTVLMALAVVGFLGNNLDAIIKAVFGSCGFVWG